MDNSHVDMKKCLKMYLECNNSGAFLLMKATLIFAQPECQAACKYLYKNHYAIHYDVVQLHVCLLRC